jgi:hypothetical protein
LLNESVFLIYWNKTQQTSKNPVPIEYERNGMSAKKKLLLHRLLLCQVHIQKFKQLQLIVEQA